MKATLLKLFDYQALSQDEARLLLHEITQGKYTEHQLASLMTVYLMRAISIEELEGFAQALMELCIPVSFEQDSYIDIVGTGGDGKDTFNISTCAGFVVAGAGYKVVKHGNYGSTSMSGASNVMEQSGVKFTTNQRTLQQSLDEAGMAYLHAPLFNPAMKAVAGVRKSLGVRTFFNILGPLVNPSSPPFQLLGVYNLSLLRLYAYQFQHKLKSFAVVHSLDGYDEISLTSSFKVVSSKGEKIFTPEQIGLTTCSPHELHAGATLEEAAQLFYQVLQGQSTESQRQVVEANAAFAIQTLAPALTIEECIAKARVSIDSGQAWEKFKTFVAINS